MRSGTTMLDQTAELRLKDKKILIVDDERSIRRTLRDILEFEKYKVDEAGD